MTPFRIKLRRKPRYILSGSAVAILGLTAVGMAVENLWTGATSKDWNVPTNWSLGRVPTSTNGQPTGDPFDDAVINTLTNFPVVTADIAAIPREIVVGGTAGATGQVDHRAGLVATASGGLMYVGRETGTGTYNLANTAGTGGTLTAFATGTGSLNVSGRLYIGGFNGPTAGSVGTFNMNTAGTLQVGNDLTIGSAGGTGVMNVDAGTVNTSGWNFIGRNEGAAGAKGTLKMSGGTITNNGARTFIGLGDTTGTMEMSGGTYNNSAGGNDTFFAIGVNNISNATTPTLNMTGGTINSAHVFSIGGVEAFNGNGDANFVGVGKGAAIINGATARLNSFGEFWVGQGGGSTGELTLNAGTLAVDNWIDIGRFGATGKVTMTGGNLIKTGGGHTLVGDGTGAVGTLKVSGGDIALNTGELWVGQNGSTGTLDMSGGTLTVNNWTAIGRAGGTGTFNLSGGTFTKQGPNVFILSDPLNTGFTTTSFLVQSGASVLNTNEIWVGQNVGGNATYTMTGGTMTSTGWIAVGRQGGIGKIDISGGTIVKAGNSGSNIIVGSLGGNGTINQSGGSISTNAGAGSIFMGEGTSQALWDLSGGTMTTDALVVGWNGGQNELRVRGTGLITAGHINVGEGGGLGSIAKGIVNQTGGTITSGSWIAVGLGSTQLSEYNLSGGTTNAVGIEVADTQGIIRVSETGILNISENIELPSRNGIGVIDITGGTINTVGYLQGGRDTYTGGSGQTNQSAGTVNVSGDLVVQRPGVGTGAYRLSGGTLAVNGAIQGTLGTFTFTGGKITRSTPGVITYNGNLTTGSPTATLGLNADKTFQITGILDNTVGLTLDLTGLGIPDQPSLAAPATGSFPLGLVGIVPAPGSFDIGRTFDLGFDANFTVGAGSYTAQRINEDAPFNPLTQSVYWLDEDAGVVSLQYSVIPEPGSIALLTVAGVMLAGCRRRRK